MESKGHFSERREVNYTPEDIRFTCRNNILYATFLGWPGENSVIRFNQDESSSFATIKRLEASEIESVRMLGVDRELEFAMTRNGLEIKGPSEPPCQHAFVYKIVRKEPFES